MHRCVHSRAHTHALAYTHTNTHIHSHAYTHTRTHMHACMHTSTHIKHTHTHRDLVEAGWRLFEVFGVRDREKAVISIEIEFKMSTLPY